MVTVLAKTYRSDDGATYTGYGLQCGAFQVEDISLSYEEMRDLARLCNRLQVTGEQLWDIARDFVQR